MAGWWSGGRLQGDLVAERLELADEVAGLAALVDAAGVVVGAQIVEAGGGVGEQVPDDHQDRAGDGDQRFELADAPDEAAVALAEEGVGLGGGGGSLAERGLEVGVALAGGAAAAGGAGLDGPGRQPGPRHQLPGGGELAHVQPDLGDDDLGGVAADPGDLVQAVHHRQGRGQDLPGLGVDPLGRARHRPGRPDAIVDGCAWVAARAEGWWRGGRDGRDRLFDPAGELVDLAAEGVDLVPQHPRHKAWWSENWPVRASTSAACLTRSRPRASSASTLGSRSPVTSASSMARPETPKMSVATVESLIRASTRQPAQAAACAGSAPGSGPHAAGCSPAAGGSGRAGRTRAAACPARSTCTATPHPACRSWDGQAGARASRALTSHTTSPRACSRST